MRARHLADGFDAEWRAVGLVDGRRRPGQRCEIFDETDLDAALARFDELHPQERGWKTRPAEPTTG